MTMDNGAGLCACLQVVDSNPYSRLMALKRMGIVANYEKIRDFSVIVVGLGGIGRYVTTVALLRTCHVSSMTPAVRACVQCGGGDADPLRHRQADPVRLRQGRAR